MKHLKRLLVGGAMVASAVAVAQPAPPNAGRAPGANGQPGKPAEMNRSQPGQPGPNQRPGLAPNGGGHRAHVCPQAHRE